MVWGVAGEAELHDRVLKLFVRYFFPCFGDDVFVGALFSFGGVFGRRVGGGVGFDLFEVLSVADFFVIFTWPPSGADA